ncbi:MAG: InlB B-repeat-containing protein, partial [Chloroflexi bacterium]|nr:InlB B-repeat-containing protein [Chloroflexota bacterium]
LMRGQGETDGGAKIAGQPTAAPAAPLVIASPAPRPAGTAARAPQSPDPGAAAAKPPAAATVVPHPPVTHGTIVTPPLPKPTPGPATPLLAPAPASLALTLKITNPDFGDVRVEPFSANNQYPRGARVTLTATPKPGHKFTGWQGDATGAGNSITVVMDGHKTISGDFARVGYALTIEPSPQGGTVSVSPGGRSFEAGARVSLEARPAAGFIFDSWSGDASGSQNPVSVTMDGDKKIAARFVQGQYALNVKVSPVGFVDISPPGGHQDSGARVTLTARPSPNFRFVSWSGDATGASPSVTITMNSNKNVTANFIKIVTLTTVVNPFGYGTVSPTTSDYDQGTEVTVTATPYPGFEFVGWTGHIRSSNLTERIVMDSDRSLMANFEIIRQNR